MAVTNTAQNSTVNLLTVLLKLSQATVTMCGKRVQTIGKHEYRA